MLLSTICRFGGHAWRRHDSQMLAEVMMKRLATTSAGSATFSSAWANVDDHQNDDTLQTPDPVDYLRGLDDVPAIAIYKDAILRACDLRSGDRLLDIGCGTATHAAIYSKAVGSTGRVIGVDTSEQLIQQAKAKHAQANNNTSFRVANVYSLPFQSNSFEVVKEDRVLQHLGRPLEAVQEMLRVVQPGGIVVTANPDFRTFQIDVTGAGRGEIGKRWGEKRRPPSHLSFDLGDLTTKVLNGVIPTLNAHSYMGLAQPRLLNAAGAIDIQLDVVPVTLVGRQNLEAVVPISYMARLSVNNGGITEGEMHAWLDRLEWEGPETMLGTLNFYICRAVKPGAATTSQVVVARPEIGTTTTRFPSSNVKPKHDVQVRVASLQDSLALLEQATELINNEYASSDTGITLSSTRVALKDVQHMVKNGELMLAMDESSTNELLGCIQVEVKGTKNSGNSGLPDLTNEKVGEFTCFAVRGATHYTVTAPFTQKVVVDKAPSPKPNVGGRGIGVALVRAAEAYARQQGCTRMQLGIMCPAQGPEPEYKQWLQQYYMGLGYEHHSTIYLEFEKDQEGNVMVDQLHDMYEPLRQLVQCRAILFDKKL
jgi:SAM-dependent methyltransferase